MAHFVGKQLHIRPNEILDTWGCAELLVAYGEYANEIADKNYREWNALGTETKVKIPRPDRYFVEFVDG